jgi:hypothetical protein
MKQAAYGDAGVASTAHSFSGVENGPFAGELVGSSFLLHMAGYSGRERPQVETVYFAAA